MTSVGRATSILTVLCAAVLVPAAASANGRFPRAERLLESPTDPNKLYLAATHGIVVTEDRGHNWRLVCDAAFSFLPYYTGDPLLSLTGDESLLVGVQAALSISRDRGCDWKVSLGLSCASKAWFTDFTVAPSAGHPIYVVATTFPDGGPPESRLQKSIDDAATWQPIGNPLPAFWVLSLEVDPTNPHHLYATGLTDGTDHPDTGIFMVSIDEGMTWSKTAIPGTYEWASPYIAAVHPTDPKKIFVRTDAWKNRDLVQTADDALLYSADEGKTWRDVLHPGGPDADSPGAKLFGFALSPDGSTALAGYGDPVDGSVLVEPAWFGVYKSSSDGQYSFGDAVKPTPMLAEPISCVTWTTTGAYFCVTPQREPSTVVFLRECERRVARRHDPADDAPRSEGAVADLHRSLGHAVRLQPRLPRSRCLHRRGRTIRAASRCQRCGCRRFERRRGSRLLECRRRRLRG
jgi:hypothetical protein